MLSSQGFPTLADNIFHVTLSAFIVYLPFAFGTCMKKELIASEPKTIQYSSESIFHWMSWTAQSQFNANQFYCETLFRAAEIRDIIRLEVIISYMKPRMSDNDLCSDKVTVYDGSSPSNERLGDFCGDELPVFESSGNSLLLVIETYKTLFDRQHIGFLLNYSSIDGSHRTPDDSYSSVDASTVIPVVLSVVVVCCVLLVILYNRCKHARRDARRSLPVSAHAPVDLTVPSITVHDQNACLVPPSYQQNQPVPNTGITPDIVISSNMVSRPGSSQGLPNPGRVRHPAGNLGHHHQAARHRLNAQLPAQDGICHDDGSVSVSGRDASINDLVGYSLGTQPKFPSDPSGIFYAGNIDELGILHPQVGQTHMSPASSSSYTHVCHMDNADCGLRESGQCYMPVCHSGRTSPRDSVNRGSRGHDSARRGRRPHNLVVIYSGCPQLVKNVDSEEQTLTFYGMIDSAVVASGVDNAVGVSDLDGGGGGAEVAVVRGYDDPPPSYEEAATGKYAPR